VSTTTYSTYSLIASTSGGHLLTFRLFLSCKKLHFSHYSEIPIYGFSADNGFEHNTRIIYKWVSGFGPIGIKTLNAGTFGGGGGDGRTELCSYCHTPYLRLQKILTTFSTFQEMILEDFEETHLSIENPRFC
jgi:hypothetical protein